MEGSITLFRMVNHHVQFYPTADMKRKYTVRTNKILDYVNIGPAFYHSGVLAVINKQF